MLKIQLVFITLGLRSALRPSSILIVNIVSLYTLKTENNKNFADLMKYFEDFQNFQKSNFVTGKFSKIRSSINLSQGPDRFNRFDGYWIQTKKTDSQTSKVFIDVYIS